MRRVTIATLLCSLLFISCFKKEQVNTSKENWTAIRNAPVFSAIPAQGETADSIGVIEIEKEYSVVEESGVWVAISMGENRGWVKRENLFQLNRMKVLAPGGLKTINDTFQLKPGVALSDTVYHSRVVFNHGDSTVSINETSETSFKSELKMALASARFLDTLRLAGNRSVSEEKTGVIKSYRAMLFNDKFEVIDTLTYGREVVWSGDIHVRVNKYSNSVNTTTYFWVKPKGGRSGYIYPSGFIPDSYLAYDKTHNKDFAFTFIVKDTIGDSARVYRPKDSSMVALKDISTRGVSLLNEFCVSFVYHNKSWWDKENERSTEKMERLISILERESHPMLNRVKEVRRKMRSLEFLREAGDTIKDYEYLSGRTWLEDQWFIWEVVTGKFPVKGLSLTGVLYHLWSGEVDGQFPFRSGAVVEQFPEELWEYVDTVLVPVDSAGNGLHSFEPFFEKNRNVLRQLYLSYDLLYSNNSDTHGLVNLFYEWVITKGVHAEVFTRAWGEEDRKCGTLYPDFVFDESDENIPLYDKYIGFILRRSFDSSHYYIWKILVKILWAYDQEWYMDHRSSFTRAPRGGVDQNLYGVSSPDYSSTAYDRVQRNFLRECDYPNFMGRTTFKERNLLRDSANTLIDTIASRTYLLAEVVNGEAAKLSQNPPVLRFGTARGVVDTLVIVDSSGGMPMKITAMHHNRSATMFSIYGQNELGRHSNVTITLADSDQIAHMNGYYSNKERKKISYWLIPENRKDEFMRSGPQSNEEQGFEADTAF